MTLEEAVASGRIIIGPQLTLEERMALLWANGATFPEVLATYREALADELYWAIPDDYDLDTIFDWLRERG